MPQPNITNELEHLIDRTGLMHVLTGLELICAQKAEHIRANWQDKATARPWDLASKRLGQLARETEI